jgi:hypothetical protein
MLVNPRGGVAIRVRRGSNVVLATAALVVLALLAVFAIELASTQAKSRQDVESRVHERAVLAAALIDSLFQSTLLQIPQFQKSYGAPAVSAARMNASRGQNAYLALLGSSGRVLASSSGFTAQARADLAISAALALVRSGHPYGFGNVLPYGRTDVINLAVAFPTRSGTRILLTGVIPSTLSPFLSGELRRIPGVKGARNYVLDAHLRVIASSDPLFPPGYRFTQAAYVAALSRRSGDYQGYYYDEVSLQNSTWRIVLAAPDGPLFASVSGLRGSVPWLIFAAFAMVAATALALGARILRSAEGRVTATEREALSERKRLERQLAQMQRLESLGQLAGGVAHDFNNLLAAIINYAQFVAEEVGAAARIDPGRWAAVADDVEEIERAAHRASGLTRQLLAFARREVTHPEVMDLNDVVEDTEQLLQRTLGEHIELRCTLAADASAVVADPGQIEQVLINLAVNGRDAMPDGGTLTIETSNVEVDATYASARPELTPGPYVRLRVSDTGAGMDADTLERAFEPFFSTKPAGAGTGLGLATIYGIVSQSGGRVSLYSEPGVGTTCTIMMPATEQVAVARAASDEEERGGTGEVILVVEDEDGIREVARRILTRRGYEVLAAANGPEAIEIARSHEGPLDLLMTDVIMPRMLGKEVAQRVAEIRPTVRVMFMSGYAQPILDANANVPGDLILLEKPFTEQALLAKVREALTPRAPAS